jgi:hypothetical protein
MKTNLKTFYDGFAKVEEKCKRFSYNPNDVACFCSCPYSHTCQWLHDFEAELRFILKATDGDIRVTGSFIIKEILGEADAK